jgi:CheY-specific phosphatase CheX
MHTLLSEPNLKTFMDDTVITVFDTMLGMAIDPSVGGAVFPPPEPQVIGMVGLAGAITAVVCLRVPESFSEGLTRAMIAAGPDEPLTEADVNDVIGELANIIAGKLKSCFQTNSPCNLSLPTIARGRHIDLESVKGTQRDSFTFHCRNESVVVEFYALNSKE